ncbi:MAG TPA: hypothetical protein VE136_05160 [Anaerolineales bacterium]|nr:hypothetical protein [Anaerolineales bacterium]
MSSETKRKVPLLLWPFWAIWRLLTLILNLTGRLIAVVLGVALMIVGAILIVTIVALPIGIPIAVIGFLMVLRGLF